MMSKPQRQAGVRLPWERGCAFLVTAGADLVPDNAASTWIDTALCELEAGAPVGTARLAADALACLAKLASAAHGRRPNGWFRRLARPRPQPRSGPATTPGSS